MESRRIIKFGNSSHIISLPKNWLDKNKLNKGDTIYLTENGNSELIISRGMNEQKEELKEVIIDVENKDISQIKRELVSGYIYGYDIFSFEGKDLNSKIKKLKITLSNLIALGIIKQTQTKLIAKNFLNIRDVSINNLVREIDTIIRSMITDSKITFKEDNYNEIYNRDYDINRLSYLIFRVIKKSFADYNIARVINLDNVQLLNNWMLVLNLEKIGDEVKRIARIFKENKLKDKTVKELIEIYSIIEKEYFKAIKAYYTKDKKSAFEIAHKIKEILKNCDSLLDKDNTVPVDRIIEKFKDMEINIRNIARVTYG